MEIQATYIQIKNNKTPVKNLINAVKASGIATDRTLLVYSYQTTGDEEKNNWPGELILEIIGNVGNASDHLLEQIKRTQHGDSYVSYINENETKEWAESEDVIFDHVRRVVF